MAKISGKQVVLKKNLDAERILKEKQLEQQFEMSKYQKKNE